MSVNGQANEEFENYVPHDGDEIVIRYEHVSTVSWQNPILTLDVNGDSLITAMDALLVIRSLLTVGPRELATNGHLDPSFYYDTTGDGFLSGEDALAVIDYLNVRAEASGEPSQSNVIIAAALDDDADPPVLPLS